MKHKRYTFAKKTLVLIVVITQATSFLFAPAAQALDPFMLGGVSSTALKKTVDFVKKSFGVSNDSAQDLGQNLNVSSLKLNAPEVKLFFTPSDPKEGEKLTAQALPMYFKTPSHSLYYTWYLKRKNCDLNSNPDEDTLKECDSDDDGDITANDWKVSAMRMIVSDGFDRNQAVLSYDGNNNGDADADDTDRPEDETGDEAQGDGYQADFGGEGNVLNENGSGKGVPRCYVYDFKGGVAHELLSLSQAEANISGLRLDGNRNVQEEDGYSVILPTLSGEQRVAACVEVDRVYNSETDADENQCANPAPFDALGLVSTINNLSCTAAASENTCTYNFKLPSNDSNVDISGQPQCSSTSQDVSGTLSCPEDTTLRFVKKSEATLGTLSTGSCASYKTAFESSYEDECVAACARTPEVVCAAACGADQACIDACPTVPNPTCETNCQTKAENIYSTASCTALPIRDVEDDQSGDFVNDDLGDSTLGCRHLFPSYRNLNKSYNIEFEQNGVATTERLSVDLRNEKVGGSDKKFTAAEEFFWHTDPTDKDTADIGRFDEASVAGLGVDKFTWAYQKGDKVGVAIEGESFLASKYADATNMVMWALPNNNCPPKNVSTKVEKIKGFNVTIPVALMDLNACLKDNLVDPIGEGQAKKLEVEIIHSPDNPMNDPTEEQSGDTLNFEAIINNSSAQINQFRYKWRVSANRDHSFSSSNWDDVTAELLAGGLIEGGISEGIGMSALNLKLNITEDAVDGYRAYFADGFGYLKIDVQVEENSDVLSNQALDIRKGKADTTIKVNSIEQKIGVYAVKTEVGSDNISLKSDRDKSICSGAACFVAANDIVALNIDNADHKYSNFSWTLDGSPIVCTESVSDECVNSAGGGAQTETTFFAVKGNVGDTFSAKLTATDVATHRNVELVKNFQIIEPYVRIVSGNDAVEAQVTGAYTDLDENSYTDYSDTMFNLQAGKIAELKLEFYPESFEDKAEVAWFLDGVKEKSQRPSDDEVKDKNGYTLTFSNNTEDKPIGSLYNVETRVMYSQPKDIRQALNKIWGISQFDSSGRTLAASIKIEVAESDEQFAAGGSKGALANFASNASSYVLFLLKVMLSAGLILFVTGTIFTFTPGIRERY